MDRRLVASLVECGFTKSRALEIIGISRTTWYYLDNPRPRKDSPVAHKDRVYPNALSLEEKRRVASELLDPRVASLSAGQIQARLEAQGVYLASRSTFYRIEKTLSRARPKRGRRKEMPVKVAPKVCARRPGQVLVWDVTWLPGKYSRQKWAVYMVMDLFSRRIMGYRVFEAENQDIACGLMSECLEQVRSAFGARPQRVHSDNGSIMVSQKMREMEPVKLFV